MAKPPQRALADVPVGLGTREQYRGDATQRRLVSDDQYRAGTHRPLGRGDGVVLIVGHQPTLGRVAAVLLSGAEADWDIGKGALWWIRHSSGETRLLAAIDPELA